VHSLVSTGTIIYSRKRGEKSHIASQRAQLVAHLVAEKAIKFINVIIDVVINYSKIYSLRVCVTDFSGYYVN